MSSIWAGLIGDIVKPLADLIDSLHTSSEEKLELKNKLTKILTDADLEADRIGLAYEAEVTKRHAADMASQSVLSRNVRPATLIFLVGVYSVLAFADGNAWGFAVNPDYVDGYHSLLMMAFAFYFTGRSGEKIMKIVSKKQT